MTNRAPRLYTLQGNKQKQAHEGVGAGTCWRSTGGTPARMCPTRTNSDRSRPEFGRTHPKHLVDPQNQRSVPQSLGFWFESKLLPRGRAQELSRIGVGARTIPKFANARSGTKPAQSLGMQVDALHVVVV